MMKTTIRTTAKIMAWIVGFSLILIACKKEEPVLDLKLSQSSVEVYIPGVAATVKIESGNGGYRAEPSNGEIATASVSGETITITGKSKGETTITVTDNAGKTATVRVTVKETTIIVSPHFKWDNTTVELEKADNGWGYTVRKDRVSISSLTEKKQYVLSWKGGYSSGKKTEAKLRMLEEGKEPREVALTSLEVQQGEDKQYAITFAKDEQNGKLVFTK